MKKSLKIFLITIVAILGTLYLFTMILTTIHPIDTEKALSEFDANNEPSEEKLAPRYRESIEEALKEMRFEDNYMSNLDEVIKIIENDKYALLFYKAIKNEKTVATNVCKFKIKYEDNKKMYAILTRDILEFNRDVESIFTQKEIVETSVKHLDFIQRLSFSPDKKFVWNLSEMEKIYLLKIEGQVPDEIIPVDVFGETQYLWYYLDLQTNGKAPDELVVEMDE